jgi:hypothetical protein
VQHEETAFQPDDREKKKKKFYCADEYDGGGTFRPSDEEKKEQTTLKSLFRGSRLEFRFKRDTKITRMLARMFFFSLLSKPSRYFPDI